MDGMYAFAVFQRLRCDIKPSSSEVEAAPEKSTPARVPGKGNKAASPQGKEKVSNVKQEAVKNRLKNILLRTTFPARKFLADLTISPASTAWGVQSKMIEGAGYSGIKLAASLKGGSRTQRVFGYIGLLSGYAGSLLPAVLTFTACSVFKSLGNLLSFRSTYIAIFKPLEQMSTGFREAEARCSEKLERYDNLMFILDARKPAAVLARKVRAEEAWRLYEHTSDAALMKNFYRDKWRMGY